MRHYVLIGILGVLASGLGASEARAQVVVETFSGDGTEASFLSSTYTGTASVPVGAGPATVPITGAGTFTNLSPVTGTMEIPSLDLGASFGLGNLDILPGVRSGGFDIPSWLSPVVPELDGLTVKVAGSSNINVVDPLNGIINLTFDGNVILSSLDAIPDLSTWGWALFLAGLLGATLHLSLRRA